MVRKGVIISLCCFVALVLSGCPKPTEIYPNVKGTWDGILEKFQDDFILNIQSQDGGSFSGNLVAEGGGHIGLINGTVEMNGTILFVEYGGMGMLRFDGTVSGDFMSGNCLYLNGEPVDMGTWTAVRR